MARISRRCSHLYLLLLAAQANTAHANDDAPYDYWCVGKCTHDATTKPVGGTILMGGGTDVAAAFAQQIAWMNGAGDFLVIRASGTDAYNPWIHAMGGTNSVATLKTNDKSAASDPKVLEYVNKAEAIFFAGGDQHVYMEEWDGTPLQQAIQAAIGRGVPVGGTSAGCDIQGGYIFTAATGGVTSDEALSNPFRAGVTLKNSSFVTHPPPSSQGAPLLLRAIIDTHFVTRDRMGRLIAFLARLRKAGYTESLAIGIDERTAFAISRDGNATVLREGDKGGRAYVLTPKGAADKCEPGTPLTWKGVAAQKVEAGDTYDFGKWQGGRAGLAYAIDVEDGAVKGDPYSPP